MRPAPSYPAPAAFHTGTLFPAPIKIKEHYKENRAGVREEGA